ncbi:MAG: response regulator transcription factor [Alphaproteobacteria bacterium]|nr:response regulator transcription factor [Alphaproteobacteria bacterium]
MSRRVLIIEDNRDIAEMVSLHLGDLGCMADISSDGRDGFEKARTGRYDLIVLDLMLPGMDGIELCRKLRSQATYTPVLMLTAKSSERDRVLGLEIGADDYLVKPFAIPELLARVKAIFRRVDQLRRADADGDMICAGELTIDHPKRRVDIAGQPVDLTSKEFDLLVHFARHQGQVYTRGQLLDSVWGDGRESYEHTVNTHINRLRSKIEHDPGTPRYLLTVWGVGYKFNDQLEG